MIESTTACGDNVGSDGGDLSTKFVNLFLGALFNFLNCSGETSASSSLSASAAAASAAASAMAVAALALYLELSWSAICPKRTRKSSQRYRKICPEASSVLLPRFFRSLPPPIFQPTHFGRKRETDEPVAKKYNFFAQSLLRNVDPS